MRWKRTAPVPAPPVPDGEAAEAIRFRAVVASGRYTDLGTDVRSSQGGAPGSRVFRVLDVGGGESVAVLRGFAGQGSDGAIAVPPVPDGEVTVEGIAFPRERLELLTRQALDDLDERAEGLLPVVVQATEAVDGLAPVPPPALGEGPHLSYAVQWFLFAAVGAVGYPMLLRRQARERPGDRT